MFFCLPNFKTIHIFCEKTLKQKGAKRIHSRIWCCDTGTTEYSLCSALFISPNVCGCWNVWSHLELSTSVLLCIQTVLPALKGKNFTLRHRRPCSPTNKQTNKKDSEIKVPQLRKKWDPNIKKRVIYRKWLSHVILFWIRAILLKLENECLAIH